MNIEEKKFHRIIGVCTALTIGFGIPVGILMSGSDRARAMITPILDIMQTMPSFVYLIPVVMLLGIGKIPGLIAVCIYAIPPIVRLTNLGIRLVDKDVLEAADAFGADRKQKLFGVQLPLHTLYVIIWIYHGLKIHLDINTETLCLIV